MVTRSVQVRLAASDGSVNTVAGQLQEYSRVDRVRRAIVVLLVAVLFAAMLIPIPIVHLLGIPLMLILGLVVGSRQLGIAYRLQPVRIECPRCHGMNRVGGGLGLRSVADPIERMCEICRRALQVQIVDA
jgi:hypothetical protein